MQEVSSSDFGFVKLKKKLKILRRQCCLRHAGRRRSHHMFLAGWSQSLPFLVPTFFTALISHFLAEYHYYHFYTNFTTIARTTTTTFTTTNIICTTHLALSCWIPLAASSLLGPCLFISPTSSLTHSFHPWEVCHKYFWSFKIVSHFTSNALHTWYLSSAPPAV